MKSIDSESESLELRLRDASLPLGSRLQMIAEAVRVRNPDGARIVDRFVARLEQAEAGSGAPQLGEAMPPFAMPDHTGRLVRLDELLEQGPLVLAYHRGHWCPYCQLNMAGLAEIQDQIAPARIVAISAELPRFTAQLRESSGAHFSFLSDLDAGYALSINLAILLDPQLAAVLAASGKTVPEFQGGSAWIVPVPAVFVLDRAGIVRARHVDPDYRRRMELDAILAAIAEL